MSLYNIFHGLGRRELLCWMSDKMYLSIGYRLKFGKKLDLKNPKTFNEKLQWLKLYDRKKVYSDFADKYKVKKYIADLLGSEYVIPTLGVWKNANDIDFDLLPNQFVLKCNHDSGSVIICRNKKELNIEEAKKSLNKSLKHTGYWYGREWPYKNIEPVIIAEEYMEDNSKNDGLTDYKFFCFHSEPKMVYISVGLENHATARISFYDLEGNEMPFHRSDYKQIETNLKIPDNYHEMVRIVKKIAKKIDNPFIRIDLYSISGRIYFSEITFYPCNGMLPFTPSEWDEKIGDWIRLPL